MSESPDLEAARQELEDYFGPEGLEVVENYAKAVAASNKPKEPEPRPLSDEQRPADPNWAPLPSTPIGAEDKEKAIRDIVHDAHEDAVLDALMAGDIKEVQRLADTTSIGRRNKGG